MCRVIEIPRYGVTGFMLLSLSAALLGLAVTVDDLLMRGSLSLLAAAVGLAGGAGLAAEDRHDMAPSTHLR